MLLGYIICYLLVFFSKTIKEHCLAKVDDLLTIVGVGLNTKVVSTIISQRNREFNYWVGHRTS